MFDYFRKFGHSCIVESCVDDCVQKQKGFTQTRGEGLSLCRGKPLETIYNGGGKEMHYGECESAVDDEKIRLLDFILRAFKTFVGNKKSPLITGLKFIK